MLHSVTLECACAAIIHVHRQGHSDGTLRIHQPFAIVLSDAQIIRDDLELIAGHFKNFVVVNRHCTKSAACSVEKGSMLFAPENVRVKYKPAQGSAACREDRQLHAKS